MEEIGRILFPEHSTEVRNAIVDDYRPISLLVQGANNPFYVTVELEAEND